MQTTPQLPSVPTLTEAPASMLSPAEFATNRISTIGGALMGVAGPVLGLALAGIGLKMVVTGEPPAFLKKDSKNRV